MPYRKAVCCAVAALLAASRGMAQPAPRPDSACAGCHKAQTIHQGATPMGHALLLPGANPTLQAHPNLTLHAGPFTYSVETREGKSTYRVSDGTRTLTLPILWAMGLQMQTWVFERDGHFYQSRVSYYPTIQGLALTAGDEGLSPQTLEQAVGRELKPAEARDCFGCHSSNAVADGQLTLDSLQPGVACEHCHIGSSLHLASAAHGDYDFTPPHLKNYSAEQLSNFCGQCHRSWETVIRNGIRGEANVRFQPYRLENSKCFDGADARISCLACHNPHEDVVHAAAAYDPKCLACHQAAGSSKSAPASAAPACPVANSKCVTCHMPKVNVNSPAGLLQFTDHQIRIVKPGAPYPN